MRYRNYILYVCLLVLVSTLSAATRTAGEPEVALENDSVFPWRLCTKISPNQDGVSVWITDVQTRETIEAQNGLITDAEGVLVAYGRGDTLPDEASASSPAQLLCGHTYVGVVFDPGTGTYHYSDSHKNC